MTESNYIVQGAIELVVTNAGKCPVNQETQLMRVDKRIPLTILIICFLACSVVYSDENRESPKRYRVIFNCDGHAVFKDAGGDLQRWIDNLFGPLENSHVDALFWCDGAGGNTANYESRVLELTGARISRVDPHLKRMIAAGNDPPKVVVREAKKRGMDVFYSFRINDIPVSYTHLTLPTILRV